MRISERKGNHWKKEIRRGGLEDPVVSLICPWEYGGSGRWMRGRVISPCLLEKLPPFPHLSLDSGPSGLITLMVVAVIKASWLQTPLFARPCFPSIKMVFRMLLPPCRRMQSRQNTLDLGVINRGLGQVITFEEETARNCSGPATLLIK